MKTEENWQTRVLPKILKAKLPPRLQKDMGEATGWDRLPCLGKYQSIFLWGEKGAGKTVQACQLMVQEMQRVYFDNYSKLTPFNDFCFITVPDLIREIKSCYEHSHPKGWTEYQTTEYYRTVYFLVLDDMGVLKPTDWVYQNLFHIINHRYDYMLPTVFTSNMYLDDVADLFGDDRITSRIERMSIVSEKRNWKTIN